MTFFLSYNLLQCTLYTHSDFDLCICAYLRQFHFKYCLTVLNSLKNYSKANTLSDSKNSQTLDHI